MKRLIFILTFTGLSLSLFAQSIGINATGSPPDPSAILDVQATNKGMLIPRMSTTERLRIPAAATGLWVYDTSTESFWYRNARDWVEIQGSHEFPLDQRLTITPPALDANFSNVNLGASGLGNSSYWQSLTALKSGGLKTIDFYLINNTSSNQTVPIKVYQGEGIWGALLFQANLTVPPTGVGLLDFAWISIPLGDTVFVRANALYTLELDLGGSSVGWEFGPRNPYPGGIAGNIVGNADFMFRTYVEKQSSVYQADTVKNTFSYGNEAIYVAPSTYVGIGTRRPASPLHLVANTAGGVGAMTIQNLHPDGFAGTYYRDRDGSQSGFIGWTNTGAPSFGTGAGALQVGTGTSAPLILNPGPRNLENVGIGTTTPTKARLEISGGPLSSLSNYGYLSNNRSIPAGFNLTSGSQTYSIYASGRIACSEFNAFSDARIKHIQGISDAAADLHTLMQIEITDYQMRDSIGKGTDSYKKVIAQQVAEVYPQAVKRDLSEVIPDIYTQAAIQDGWIMLETDLTIGERVKLITEKSSEVYTVSAVEAHRFQVSDLTPDSSLPTSLFVYGREVDDFHTVDYEALSMLNVSATQEQQKIIEGQKLRIKSLQRLLKQAEQNIHLFETQFRQLETKLKQHRTEAAHR